MRKNGTLSYLLTEHLGSTSIMTNASGAMTSQMKYKAWGEVRFASGTNPTKYTYTGQYSNVSDFGLMFYNARWYDPLSGRFAQADTIVPAGVQGLDRYAYVNNSPIQNADPTGHLTDKQIEKWTGLKVDNINEALLKMLRAARFGDALYGYDKDGDLVGYGILQLDDTGHLVFGSTTTFDLLNSGMAGWMLARNIGDKTYLAYSTGGYEYPSDVGEKGLYPLGEGQEEVVSTLNKLVETSLGGAAVGLGVEGACKGCSKGTIVVLTIAMGFLYGVGDLVFGSQPGDETLTYYYEDSSGQIWQQVVVLRDGQIIKYEVAPYVTPWYVPYLPSEN